MSELPGAKKPRRLASASDPQDRDPSEGGGEGGEGGEGCKAESEGGIRDHELSGEGTPHHEPGGEGTPSVLEFTLNDHEPSGTLIEGSDEHDTADDGCMSDSEWSDADLDDLNGDNVQALEKLSVLLAGAMIKVPDNRYTEEIKTKMSDLLFEVKLMESWLEYRSPETSPPTSIGRNVAQWADIKDVVKKLHELRVFVCPLVPASSANAKPTWLHRTMLV